MLPYTTMLTSHASHCIAEVGEGMYLNAIKVDETRKPFFFLFFF